MIRIPSKTMQNFQITIPKDRFEANLVSCRFRMFLGLQERDGTTNSWEWVIRSRFLGEEALQPEQHVNLNKNQLSSPCFFRCYCPHCKSIFGNKSFLYVHTSIFLGGDTYVAHGFCLPVVVSTAARPQLLRLTPGLIFDQICTLEASEGAERVNSWSSRCEISILCPYKILSKPSFATGIVGGGTTQLITRWSFQTFWEVSPRKMGKMNPIWPIFFRLVGSTTNQCLYIHIVSDEQMMWRFSQGLRNRWFHLQIEIKTR